MIFKGKSCYQTNHPSLDQGWPGVMLMGMETMMLLSADLQVLKGCYFSIRVMVNLKMPYSLALLMTSVLRIWDHCLLIMTLMVISICT